MSEETEAEAPKKRGRPSKGDAMVAIHLRVPADVYEYYKNFSEFSTTMREALRAYMKKHI